MIYAYFEIILVPEDNEKQFPNESYINKYQKHVASTYGCKLLLCFDHKISKPFKPYLGKDAVYNFILIITKKHNADFDNSTACWICVNAYFDADIKLTDHCHITGKYRRSAHRNTNFNVTSNHKISIVFHNLKHCDSYLIMQELGKFNFKINFIPNGLGQHMSFSINNNLRFIDSFQFLSFLLNSSVKKLVKNILNV